MWVKIKYILKDPLQNIITDATCVIIIIINFHQ